MTKTILRAFKQAPFGKISVYLQGQDVSSGDSFFGTGSAGMLKATQDHLEDMRKITFNKLKIQER